MSKLNLSNNEILSLNKSLIPLVSLEYLNLTNNKLTEFSADEIQGLKYLKYVELCHNKISKFTGRTKVLSNSSNVCSRVLEIVGPK